MRHVTSFQSSEDAAHALDNGGRFYNLLAERDDGVVAGGELARAAGVFIASDKAFLFLEMSLGGLDEMERAKVISLLDENLRRAYATMRPIHLHDETGEDSVYAANQPFIVEGYAARLTPLQTTGVTTTTLLMVGKVFIPMQIPISDGYQMFSITHPLHGDAPFPVAVAKDGDEFADKIKVQIGGVLKEAQYPDDNRKVFLEAMYYSRL